MKIVVCGIALGLMLFAKSASANLLEVKKAVEEAHCKKLASAYAKDPSGSTVQAIAQLQICLAETLKTTTARAIPRNFNIQPPRPSNSRVDTTLPREPTPPTPPSSIKVQ